MKSIVIINIIGNLFSGIVVFETAEKLTRHFGKTNQRKESITYAKSDTTINVSTQQANLIPASKISTLKQGKFIGHFVYNFGEEFDLKYIRSLCKCRERLAQKNGKLLIINNLAVLVQIKYDVGYQKINRARETFFQKLAFTGTLVPCKAGYFAAH